MEQFTIKEFTERLRADSLKTCTVTGLAKKSDNATEINFKPVEAESWTKLPISLIGNVMLIKDVACGDEHCALVKLHLLQPSTPEGKVLYELLSSVSDHSHCMCRTHTQHKACDCAGENIFRPLRQAAHDPHLCTCGCAHCACGTGDRHAHY